MNRPGFAGGSCVDAPFHASAICVFEHVIGCGHVSGLWCGVGGAAGRHGDTRIRRKSTRRASRSWSLGAFPDPDQTDHLPLTFTTSSHAAHHGLAVAEHMLRLLRCQDPGSPPSWSTSPIPSEPSCWPCHGDQHQRFAIQHSGEPRAWSRAASRSPLDDGHGADDQQPPDVPLTHLRRAAEPLLSACRMLNRHQPQPGGEVATALEGRHWRRKRFHRHGRDRADSRHGLKAACILPALGFAAEDFLQLGNFAVQPIDVLQIDATNVEDQLGHRRFGAINRGCQGFQVSRTLEPIGNIPPAEAEARYYAMLEEPAMAA